MKFKLLHEENRQRTFALIFDTGDEVMQALQKFADEQHLAGSHFTAIGAFSDVTLAWFDWQSKQYKRIPVREQVEVLMLAGDISEQDGSPKSTPTSSSANRMAPPTAATSPKPTSAPHWS